ncbi:MAG: response regulator, partial [Pseudomonadota bacterium]
METATQKPEVKILLVDDEAFMREIIVNALSAGGYREIRPLSKLESLHEVVESYFPDLLVINGEMGDGQALEVVRRIRHFRIGRNPFLPIVMTSWNSEGPFVRKVVDCGADVLMIKPLAAGQLLARLDFL